MLDDLGPPRHLEARREITLHEARKFMRNLDQRHRHRRIAQEMGLTPKQVEHIWLRLLEDASWLRKPLR